MLHIPLDEPLVILEAPTGEGKTEAALIYALRLVRVGAVDGVYFAVPTRSAASELHSRIAAALVPDHPVLAGAVVRAVPGLLDTNPWQGEPHWAMASPKRTFAAPIAVGTIDQADLSILQVHHFWMRAALLARHLLIIDEVHAGDPYMTTVAAELVRRHVALGGRVLAMSATVGEAAKAALTGRHPVPPVAAEAVPYPAVLAACRAPPCRPLLRAWCGPK